MIISYCVTQNYLSKQSLKFVTIISAENKADTRIYGTICQSHAVDNIEIMWDATIRKYDSVRKEANTPEDSDGEPAYCKSQHNSNGHLQHILFSLMALLFSICRLLAWNPLRLEL